jgi:hypothetical protein
VADSLLLLGLWINGRCSFAEPSLCGNSSARPGSTHFFTTLRLSVSQCALTTSTGGSCVLGGLNMLKRIKRLLACGCRWVPIRVRPSPPGRFGHSLCVSSDSRRLVLFGGCVDTSPFLSLTRTYAQTNELWILDLASFR